MDNFKHNELTFHLMVEASPNALILVNNRGNIVYTNAFAETLFQYSRNELIGRNIEILIPHKFAKEHPSLMRSYLTDPIRRQMGTGRDLYAVKKGGIEFPVEIGLNPITTVDGILILVAIIDITERKRAEKQFQLIVESVPNAIILVDSEGIITLVNKQAENEFGYAAAELIGHKVEMLIPERFRSNHIAFRDMFLSHPVTRAMGAGRTLFALRKDGTEFPAEIGLNPITTDTGIQILTSIINISERKQYEQELIAARDEANSANRAKSEFLANMSHEIRTPMHAMLGFSELLQNMVSDPQQQSYIKAILNSGKTLLLLINDILDLSKVEAGRLEFFYELEDVNAIVQEIQQIFSVRTQEKKIGMFVESSMRERFIVDSTRLRQVLLNVVGNAVKFTDNGFVKITVREERLEDKGRVLCIAIEDTGIGIANDQQSLIFEAFRQQDGQSTRRYGGTGLGLSITKRLVEAMNGTIAVRSEVGKGSTFEIVLPEAAAFIPSGISPMGNGVAIEEGAVIEEGAAIEEGTVLDFGEAVLLVVDDIELNRTLVREMLEGNNVRIIECWNGKEAVEAAQQHRPDMILMDLRMPDMNGDEAVQCIRSIPEIEKTPVAFLTASAMQEESFAKTLKEEVYLYKPVSQKELLTLLASTLPHTVVKKAVPPMRLAQEKVNIVDSSFFDKEEYDARSLHVLPALLQSFRTDFMPVWVELIDAPVVDEVEVFARKLQVVGIESGVRMVARYSEVLLNQVELVDVVAFPTTLAMFADLVRTLERIYNNSAREER